NAGNNSLLPAGVVYDQRGFARTASGTVDIGAFERDSVDIAKMVVDSTSDVDDGNFGPGELSLREAIELANLSPDANTISFNVSGIINLTGALPDMTSNINITGPGVNALTVHRDTGGGYRIFTIGNGATVGISGLTLTGGNLFNGGGIFNSGTLTLTECTVS